MAYNRLSESTLTERERIDEAQRIYRVVAPHVDRMRDNERSLVERVGSRPNMPISVAQLFYLRDIRDEVLS